MSLLGKMMGVSHTTISTWEYVKNNANEKQIQDLRNGKVTANKVAAQFEGRRKTKTIDSAGQVYKFQIHVTQSCYDLLRRLSRPCNTYQNTKRFCVPYLLDPPYAEEHWYLYEALPPIVMAKLKPNGHFVSLFGDS